MADGTYQIVPAKRRIGLRDVWTQRAVIRVVAARDFKAKYKQSLLGQAWLVIQPAGLLLSYVVVFTSVTHVKTGGVPYVLFVLAGLAPWAYFQAALTMGTASIVSNYTLVRRTACTRIAFPISSLIVCTPTLLATLAGALVLGTILGGLTPRLVLLPLAFAWLFVLTSGLVALTSAITVRFRDLLTALPFLLQIGAFVSPVGYSASGGKSFGDLVLLANPVSGLMEVWRWTILNGIHPHWTAVGISLLWTIVIGWAGWSYFVRYEVRMADEI